MKFTSYLTGEVYRRRSQQIWQVKVLIWWGGRRFEWPVNFTIDLHRRTIGEAQRGLDRWNSPVTFADGAHRRFDKWKSLASFLCFFFQSGWWDRQPPSELPPSVGSVHVGRANNLRFHSTVSNLLQRSCRSDARNPCKRCARKNALDSVVVTSFIYIYIYIFFFSFVC